jgi:hypothetical protein
MCWCILRWMFRKLDVEARTGSIRVRVGTDGGHLWMRQWNFGLIKAGNFLTSWKSVSFWRAAAWSEWVSKKCARASFGQTNHRQQSSTRAPATVRWLRKLCERCRCRCRCSACSGLPPEWLAGYRQFIPLYTNTPCLLSTVLANLE